MINEEQISEQSSSIGVFYEDVAHQLHGPNEVVLPSLGDVEFKELNGEQLPALVVGISDSPYDINRARISYLPIREVDVPAIQLYASISKGIAESDIKKIERSFIPRIYKSLTGENWKGPKMIHAKEVRANSEMMLQAINTYSQGLVEA